MRKIMSRAAVLTGIRQMEMRDIPIPEIGAEDGLLKVEMVGVCGSDPGFYNGKTKVPFPLIMGHEIKALNAEQDSFPFSALILLNAMSDQSSQRVILVLGKAGEIKNSYQFRGLGRISEKMARILLKS